MKNRLLAVALVSAGILAWAGRAVADNQASEGPPPRPAMPAIKALRLDPAELTLEDGRDVRKALVSGQIESGEWIDLTSQAKFEPPSDAIEIDAEGYFHGRKEGKTEIAVSAAGLNASLPVTVVSAKVPPIRFVHDVMPAMSKAGCNAGTCHGSAKGKNGFKLSLRGFDSRFDYEALVDDLSGRRFNRAVPAESLMLLKPTAGVPHEGGQVIKPGSRYYKILQEWIASGVKSEDPATGRAVSVAILPEKADIPLPGMEQQILVLASYADGTVRDVTREAVFTSNNTEVAVASEKGLVTALRRGETAILVRYEGNYATKNMAVMGDRTGFNWASAKDGVTIDNLVEAKLEKMKIAPSEVAGDAEFLRRVYLDLTGLPPSPEQVREFLNDPAPADVKRPWMVNQLIGSDPYVQNWTSKWADLLQCNEQALGEKGVWLFRGWIEKQIRENTPYDEFVRSLLLARGSNFKNPAANYYRVLRETEKATEDVSQVFLGTRFNCNKCHDHPFERWTQNQYYEFGAFFARVGVKNGELPGEEIVYNKYDGGEVKHPKTGMDMAPHVPYGTLAPDYNESKRLEAFAAWMTSKENPTFAMALTNRVWSYFFGRGIIEPVDDIRTSNPPSNPELLDALTKDFVEHGFDVRHLMRTICNTEAYQRSIRVNQWNKDDVANFAHALPRRLSAEQMLDAIAVATGSKPKFKDLPTEMRAVDLPGGMVAGEDFLTLFGRPKRQSACECERTSKVSLSHALNLINGPTVGEAIANPEGRIAKLVGSGADNRKIVEEVYLSVLSRPPSDAEIAAVDLDSMPSRLEGAQDLAWALMNSPSFLFNR